MRVYVLKSQLLVKVPEMEIPSDSPSCITKDSLPIMKCHDFAFLHTIVEAGG